MNTTDIARKSSLVAAAVALGSTSGLAGVLAYDNSVNDLNYRLEAATTQIGDQIKLAAALPSHQVEAFDFEYFLVNGPAVGTTASARVRFYANDGPLYNGYASPGTPLWDSGIFSVSGTQRSTVAFDASDFGALIVPDTFTWSVEFSGIGSGEKAGVDLYSPPVIGQNWADFWVDNSGTWELRAFPSNDPCACFAARLTVVPEPSAIGSALALGLGAFFFVWKRRQTNA